MSKRKDTNVCTVLALKHVRFENQFISKHSLGLKISLLPNISRACCIGTENLLCIKFFKKGIIRINSDF